MLSGQVQYQSKAVFLNWIFKLVAISRNTGKCKLGGFCSDSHNYLCDKQPSQPNIECK